MGIGCLKNRDKYGITKFYMVWLDHFKLFKKGFYLRFGAGINHQIHPDVPNKHYTCQWGFWTCSYMPYGPFYAWQKPDSKEQGDSCFRSWKASFRRSAHNNSCIYCTETFKWIASFLKVGFYWWSICPLSSNVLPYLYSSHKISYIFYGDRGLLDPWSLLAVHIGIVAIWNATECNGIKGLV